MRIEKENGIITLDRGDSFVMPILINEGTKLSPVYRPLRDTESLYFGLMEPNQAFEDAVLKKKFTSASKKDKDGNTLLILDPEETEYLQSGKYYYTIKLKSIDENGEVFVKTLVSSTIFNLLGVNPSIKETPYYEKGKYDIDNVIFEGGEIEQSDRVVFEGGEII